MNKLIATFKIGAIEYQLHRLADGEVQFVSVQRYNDPWTWEDEEEWSYDAFHPSANPLRVIRAMAKYILTYLLKTKPPFVLFKANTPIKHKIYSKLIEKYAGQLQDYTHQDADGTIVLVRKRA